MGNSLHQQHRIAIWLGVVALLAKNTEYGVAAATTTTKTRSRTFAEGRADERTKKRTRTRTDGTDGRTDNTRAMFVSGTRLEQL